MENCSIFSILFVLRRLQVGQNPTCVSSVTVRRKWAFARLVAAASRKAAKGWNNGTIQCLQEANFDKNWEIDLRRLQVEKKGKK